MTMLYIIKNRMKELLAQERCTIGAGKGSSAQIKRWTKEHLSPNFPMWPVVRGARGEAREAQARLEIARMLDMRSDVASF